MKNWGTESFSDLSQATQLESDRAGMWIQGSMVLKSMILITTIYCLLSNPKLYKFSSKLSWTQWIGVQIILKNRNLVF